MSKHFSRESRRYVLTGAGDVNTYALFAETLLQATSSRGRAGFIVPTGIATDESTSAFFSHVATGSRLASLFDFENSDAVFPSVHRSYKFSLLTLGAATQSEFVCFATKTEHLNDERRRFFLTPDEFALINPNSRTCPVFRSKRDAELTKKLYRAAPVLLRDDEPSTNPWGIELGRMLHMSDDSDSFQSLPGEGLVALYEAKMVHQFDHRWATYVEAPDKPGGLETVDSSPVQKADPAFTVRPRYWVPEREVLARVARVPTRVARAWLAWHAATAQAATQDSALPELLLALAAWVAGELFTRATGELEVAEGSQKRVLPHIASIEAQLKASFEPLSKALLGTGLTTKQALTEFPKWALQNLDARMSDSELEAMGQVFKQMPMEKALLDLIDEWLDRRSPQWLFGFRNIARSTDERSFIASVMPRLGVGHSMPLYQVSTAPELAAALLGMLTSLSFDYVVRQKLGGTNMTFGYVEQFPTLLPKHFEKTDLDFIVPRVLELTFTAHDLRPWADALAAFDPRSATERDQPFAWNPPRRAQLRSELDAYYARLYGLTRDELRYILDPADVMGPDYPSETFRVLKNSEMREFGEYRTQRLVLQAWDKLGAAPVQVPLAAPAVTSQFSELGMIRNEEEALLAGLIVALVESRPEGSSVSELQFLVARSANAAQYLDPSDARRFTELSSLLGISNAATQLLSRALPIVQRLESVGVLARQARAGEAAFTRGEAVPPGDVRLVPEHGDVARLLVAAESRRLESDRAGTSDSEQPSKSSGTR
ncbi:hypothetical protein M0765_019605 [Variovorax sp. S2]|uniref:hypothetical protein n=1 Tax=Variovorax sp. S12S4 TaxID=3029170 RepID=UPI00215CF36F|nr:hypothetical protein [Variovorax sp. S12S4]MCR8959860.1 hypothetical protein [Variovorax sp. S12S4]